MYRALYRKYRPQGFDSVVGQNTIVKTLQNSVKNNSFSHAYMFFGPRGVGKTTASKIFARAINCLEPVDGNACGKCKSCVHSFEKECVDIIEIDAASNNGVDEIRELINNVKLVPSGSKYKVYIIDEVHMMSQGAFNALLKTLEEPPEHVKFILATTEPQKLPATILSRCQRFDFKKIPENDIVKRLKIICESSDIKIDEEALKIMAVLSEGHMRDAISILERCSQENTEMISSDEVKELVGLPSLVHINKLARGILEYDTIGALAAVDDVLEDGKDLYNFLWEVIKYFKDILVYKTTNNLKLYSDAEIVEIKRLADITEEQRLLDIVYLLSELEADIKWSSQKTIMFQTGVIKACRKETASSTSTSYSGGTSLEKRLEILENKLANMKIGQDSTIAMQELENGIVEAPKVVAAPREKKETKQVQGVPSNTQEVWKRVIDAVKNGGKLRLFTALINSRINVLNDLIWEIEFPNGITSFNKKILDDVTNQNEIIKEIFKLTGKQINLRFKDGKAQNKPSGGASPEKPKEVKDLGFEINIIE